MLPSPILANLSAKGSAVLRRRQRRRPVDLRCPSCSRFAPVSYLDGAAPLFDFVGFLPQSHLDFVSRPDDEALYLDWQIVGSDLWTAVQNEADDAGYPDRPFAQPMQHRLPLDIN